MDTVTLILGLYGTVLSTVVGIVVLTKALRDRGKIDLHALIGLVSGDSSGRRHLVVVITNVGRRPIMVDKLAGDVQDEQGIVRTIIYPPTTLPKTLNEGERTIEYMTHLDAIPTLMRLLVWDSTGRRWCLSKKGFKHLKSQWQTRSDSPSPIGDSTRRP